MKRMIIQEASTAHRGPIVDLLRRNQLPSEDLDQLLRHFWVALQQDKVVGAIGLELYGSYGLLRSMVVDQQARGQGIAAALVDTLEAAAKQEGLQAIYLLTETAPDYFSRRGYLEVGRDQVPVAVSASSEFSHLCPVSARVFCKTMNEP